MADSILKRLGMATRAAVGVFGDVNARRTWNLLQGVLPGGLGTPPTRYTRDFMRAYAQMPWLHAAANKIAMSVGMTEWKLYAAKANGKATKDHALMHGTFETRAARRKELATGKRRKDYVRKDLDIVDDLNEITDHPLLDVMNNANSFQTGLQMRKVTQLHIDLVGEAFWLKERDGMGTVVAVWPIPPDWILNTPTPTNPVFRIGYRAWRGLIPDTEILWFQDTDPANPYGRGTGTAMSVADELETDEYTAKHTKAFFYNRAKPDLLIFPKSGNIREPDIKRLETDWMQSNQGFWRAFKPYFMTREVGVHEMDQNFRAMQLVQLRQFERDVIIQTFGIPPEMLGILTHSNRSTINAASYLMGRYITQPRLEFIRTVLQEKFVPEYDDRLIVDYVTPVEEDHEAERAAATAFPWSLSMDEARQLAGLDAMDNAKEGEMHGFPTTYTFSSVEDAIAQNAEQHAANIAPKPAPMIMPGGNGSAPKPGAPKPAIPAPAARPALPAAPANPAPKEKPRGKRWTRV